LLVKKILPKTLVDNFDSNSGVVYKNNWLHKKGLDMIKKAEARAFLWGALAVILWGMNFICKTRDLI
jgi:hypothetical protein